MISINLGEIDVKLIEELCSDALPESQTVEFKRTLPGKNDADRVEFAKDICAFANADGGDIVFGVAEDDGKAAKAFPIQDEQADAAQRRLTQTIDYLVEPRIVGLQFKFVEFDKGAYVLVLRVPASFDGPHRFGVAGSGSRFVVRVGRMTQDLTYSQLRGAFDRTATLIERAREFRHRRIVQIKEGQTWRPLRHGPKWVLHLIPISAMTNRSLVNIQVLNNGDFNQFNQRDWGGASRTMNIDGLVVHPGIRANDDGRVLSYVQVFRTGALEAARYGGRLVDDQPIIPGRDLSAYVRNVASQLRTAAKTLFGISGPAILAAAILDTGGYGLGVFDRRAGMYNVTGRADRGDLVVPEAWIESIESDSDTDQFVRPLLDILYQSFDCERCYEYDEQGNWIAG